MIKKIVFKVVLMVLVFMGLGSYGAYLSGVPVPIFNADNWQALKAKVASLGDKLQPEKLADSAKIAIQGEPEKLLYKWKDATGATFFGDMPPVDALEVTVFRNQDLNVNVIAPTPLPEEPPEAQAAPAAPPALPNPYTPQGVEQILEQARDVQNKLDERMAEQQRVLDEL